MLLIIDIIFSNVLITKAALIFNSDRSNRYEINSFVFDSSSESVKTSFACNWLLCC